MSEKIEIPVEKQEYGGSIPVRVIAGEEIEATKAKFSEEYFERKLGSSAFQQEANAKIDEYFSPN